LIVIVTFSVFVMPIVYLFGLRHDISSAIANGAFGVTALIVLMIVFAEKYFPLFSLTKSHSKVLDETQPTSGVSSAAVQIFSQDVVRAMKADEQFEYYTKIIQKYTALRLQINCASEYSSHATASGHVVYLAGPSPRAPIENPETDLQ
jgi:hypothetical protein